MNSVEVSDIQAVILDSVQIIHDFCIANKINYYLIGGGLIGAIRHGGPIPWDDDIDIGMPRPDYERFIRLSKSIKWPHLISTINTDPTYIYGFAKCYDTRTSVTEELAVRFTRGIWVDVFPIDGTFDQPLLRKIHISLSRALKAIFASRCGAYVPEKQSKTILRLRRIVATSSKILSRRMLHSLLHRTLSVKKYESASYVGNLLGRWGVREICRKNVFAAQLKAPYASRQFMLPSGYDEYLRGVYGDYMKLPPKANRQPDHSTTHISLNKSFLEKPLGDREYGS